MTHLKRTPLFPLYKQAGGKTIDFGGWELPVQFSSIKEEHHAVRTKAGLFDVSHMGQFEVKGSEALAYLQKLMTNDVSKLKQGKAQYTAMCNENGGTIDDLLIYKNSEEDYLLVVNASNIQKDFEWMSRHLISNVELIDSSDNLALLAIQGPLAERVLQKLTKKELKRINYFSFLNDVMLNGRKSIVARTGYTGEDGFEIYCSTKDAAIIWCDLLEVGAKDGLIPCGLGARDTLRLEACLPLYGQELTKDITPIEAGIGFAVKRKDVPYLGDRILLEQKEKGVERKIIGIEMTGKGIARSGYDVFIKDKKVGIITSGTYSPTLKKNIALALIDKNYVEINTEVEVQIRNKRLRAKVVNKPFYKKE